MTSIEKDVLDALSAHSKSDPLTRSELKDITGGRDPQARGIIQNLRSQGYRICSSAGAKGYWIAESIEDYRAFRTEILSKAHTILKNVRAMDDYFPEQIEMREN